MEREEIQKMIDASITKAMAFQTKKYGDTPTDALQLTPKKYVDSNTGTPAGSNTQIQYNNAGSFGASADFTWDDSGKILGFASDTIIQTPLDGSTDTKSITIQTGDTGGGNDSGNIDIHTGGRSGGGQNGNIYLNNSQGNYQSSFDSGFVYIPCGDAVPATPLVTRNGAMAFLPGNGKLYIWDGSAWKSVQFT